MDGALAAEIQPTLTHGGRFIKYNIFGKQFEITARYLPPIMPIGRGAYGFVCSVMDTETQEKVAIKKIANAFGNNVDAERTLLEIKLLRHLDHENIIGIRDVIPPAIPQSFNDVYIATELMGMDLHDIIRSNQGLSEEHFQFLLYQLLRGLKYIHSANVVHLDLKPRNLLLNASFDLKICDFGLARPSSEGGRVTENVVTLRYRAPELLLKSTDYSAAIDVWSVGCILMELINRSPLFPGRDEEDQMRLITQIIGTPTDDELGFIRNEDARNYMKLLPQYPPSQSFASQFPRVQPAAADLLEKMLTFNPLQRITVAEALGHPYLEQFHDVSDEPVCTDPFHFDFEQHALTGEEIKQLILDEALDLNPNFRYKMKIGT